MELNKQILLYCWLLLHSNCTGYSAQEDEKAHSIMCKLKSALWRLNLYPKMFLVLLCNIPINFWQCRSKLNFDLAALWVQLDKTTDIFQLRHPWFYILSYLHWLTNVISTIVVHFRFPLRLIKHSSRPWRTRMSVSCKELSRHAMDVRANEGSAFICTYVRKQKCFNF